MTTPPKAGDDVADLWKPVAENTSDLNALKNCTVIPNGTRNKLTISESNATLELNKDDLGGGGGGDLREWDVIVNGLPAKAMFASSEPY